MDDPRVARLPPAPAPAAPAPAPEEVSDFEEWDLCGDELDAIFAEDPEVGLDF